MTHFYSTKTPVYSSNDDYWTDFINQQSDLNKDYNQVESQYHKELNEIFSNVDKGKLDVWSRDYITKMDQLSSKYHLYLASKSDSTQAEDDYKLDSINNNSFDDCEDIISELDSYVSDADDSTEENK